MKKTVLSLFALFSLAWGGLAQVTNLSEGFETGIGTWLVERRPDVGWTGQRDWGINASATPAKAHSGDFYCFLVENNHSGTNLIVSEDWLISPQVLLSATGNSLDFWVSLTNWSSPTNPDSLGRLEIRVSITGTDSADFTTTLASYKPVDINASYTENVMVNFTVDLSAYDGQSIYLALVKVQEPNEGPNTNGYHVDDIKITASVGTCTSAISGISSSAQSNNSVDLSWSTDGAGGEAAWNVQYGVTGFNPGSGDIISANTNTNFTVPNLMSGLVYDFYVQPDCGADQGLWVGPFTAPATTCAAPGAGDDFNNPINLVFDPLTNQYKDSLGLVCFTDQVTSAQGSADVVYRYDPHICASELKINTVRSHFYTSISLFDTGSQTLLDEMVGSSAPGFSGFCSEVPFSGRSCWPKGGNPLEIFGNSMFVVIEGSFPSEEGLLVVEFEEVLDFNCLTQGVEELKVEEGISGVFPNPGNGQYTVNLKNAKSGAVIEVLNLTGKLIQSENISKSQGQSNIQLNLENENPGVYMLRYRDAGTNQVLKLIKQ